MFLASSLLALQQVMIVLLSRGQVGAEDYCTVSEGRITCKSSNLGSGIGRSGRPSGMPSGNSFVFIFATLATRLMSGRSPVVAMVS